MKTLHQRKGQYGEGAYGIVFFDDLGFATKVFKRRTDAPESHVENVFRSEVEAYKIASQNSKLRSLIPNFIGEVEIEKIFNENGDDISCEFYLGFAYKMRKKEGLFIKYNIQDDPIRKDFIDAGIHHITDASVVLDKHGRLNCVVDIATKEYELWHS